MTLRAAALATVGSAFLLLAGNLMLRPQTAPVLQRGIVAPELRFIGQ